MSVQRSVIGCEVRNGLRRNRMHICNTHANGHMPLFPTNNGGFPQFLVQNLRSSGPVLCRIPYLRGYW